MQAHELASTYTKPFEWRRVLHGGLLPRSSMGKRMVPTGKEAMKKPPKKPSAEETALLAKIEKLVKDSNSVSGRDASVIKSEADALAAKAADIALTEYGQDQLSKNLKEIDDVLDFERKSGRFLQIVVLIVMFVPALLTYMSNLAEYVNRPTLEVDAVDMAGSNVVITGGCGTVGLELAIMIAEAGASVIIGCHSSQYTRTDSELQAEAVLANAGLLHGHEEETAESARRDRLNPDRGTIRLWPLQLQSFSEVRTFAERVVDEFQTVDVLVHNAATKSGCNRTVDGHELTYQVNYLSPFVLTQLLLPSFQSGGQTRVVHVTCDAGLQQADWLPWPLARTTPELLPKIDTGGLGEWKEGEEPGSIAKEERCAPLVQYAHSKLMVVSHSHELNRRLNHGFVNQGLSHAVNPGAMNSEFGRTDSSPSAKASMRSSMMGYFPPVWLGRKLYSVTFGLLGDGMLRSVEHGAKAIFHTATATSLGSEENGGGFYADEAGPFINCGGPAAQCGRVPERRQHPAATDQTKAGRLWSKTEEAIGEWALRPLGADKPQDAEDGVANGVVDDEPQGDDEAAEEPQGDDEAESSDEAEGGEDSPLEY